MKDQMWKPEWFTIEEFEHIIPKDIFHKEMEEEKPYEEEHHLENIHVLCRGEFNVDEDGKSYVLKISGDDHYKAYLDGEFLQEGPAPAYHSHYYYNSISLQEMHQGKHVLGIHLYYHGRINRLYNSGDYRMAVAVELRDEQGRVIPISLEYQICNAYSGSIMGYDTQFVEQFDSRNFIKNWNLKTYQVDESWKHMVRARWADYQLHKQPTKAIEHYGVIPRVKRKRQDGSYFLDSGKEFVGYVQIEAKGTAGQQVRILCGEELEEDGVDKADKTNESDKTNNIVDIGRSKGYDAGKEIDIREELEIRDGNALEDEIEIEKCIVRYNMRCNCNYDEIWTLDEGICKLHQYEYKGFRYVHIIPDEGVEILDIRLEARNYPMGEECTLISSDKDLMDIFQICRQAVKVGTQDAYLDCPTREKGQYLGDALITARSQVWLTGNTEMLLKCIDQFAQTASICSGLMAVAPGSLMQEIADFSLMYPELILTYYQFTGDQEVIRKYYQVAKGIVKHFSQFEREDGLLEGVWDKWNLVDWPDNLRDGYDFALDRPVGPGCHNVMNALYIGARKRLMEMEEIIEGNHSKSVEVEDQRKKGETKDKHTIENYIKAYCKAFYREDMGLFVDQESSSHSGLHSNVYPLYFGIVPCGKEDKIVDFIGEKGFSCGVMHSYFVLRALAQVGEYEMLYKLLMNDSEHGWKQMLREGATTCFEAWGKNQKWNTSLCHPWASGPIAIIIEEIAGIHPDPTESYGYRFAPHISRKVEYLKLQVPLRGQFISVVKDEYGVQSYHGKLK